MLTIKIWKALHKTYRQKFFLEVILLSIMVLTGLVTYFQSGMMESYRKQQYFRDVQHRNLHLSYTENNEWQEVRGTSHKLHVYSAYYDDRNNIHLIRIVGLAEPLFKDNILCQLYFQSSETEYMFVSAKVEPPLVENVESELAAVLVTCSLPEGLDVPRAVAVTASSRLMISNMLLVKRNHFRNSQSLAICVEPLKRNYSQMIGMMEFVELNRLLGIDHFFIYKQTTSESLKCLLADYVRQGQVTVMEWNVPSNATGPTQHGSTLAAFNDCLYQTMFNYKYTIFLSIDEFIIPKEANSIKSLIRVKENHNSIGALIFKVANFYLEWPDEKRLERDFNALFFMTIRKTYQTISDDKRSTKLICKPETVLHLRENLKDLQLVSGFHSVNVEELQGLCHRYRVAPNEHPPPPVAYALRDISALRFAPQLAQAVMQQYQISMPHCSLPDHENIKSRSLIQNRHPHIVLSDTDD